MFPRLLIPVVVLSAVLMPAAALHAEEGSRRPVQPKLEFVYFSLKPVSTAEIAASTQRRVEAVPGVQSFAWTVDRQEVKIVRIVGQAATPTLVAAFGQSGARATALAVSQSKLAFQNQLHCNSCVIKVKRALKPLKGVKEVQVAKDKQTVTVAYDTSKTTLPQIKRVLAAATYPVR